MKSLKIPADWGDCGSIGLFKAANALFNLLPADDAYRLGHQLARLWLTFDRGHRHIIEKNLDLALQIKPGSPHAKQLQTEITQHLGYNLCEFFLLQNPACRRLLKKKFTYHRA